MSVTYWIYKIFLLIWILGGLGYVVMILGFITQGLTSKRIHAIEQIITNNIKKTPLKIRQELRTLLQEFIFLKVKPVYKGDFAYTPHQLERSQSCPDLTMYRNKNSPTMARKRALSECPRSLILHRIQSDSDLDRIDKEQTFKPSSDFIQQKELLLRVVDALGNLEERELAASGGYHGFSDNEILASERYGSHWSLRSQKLPVLQVPKPERRRAVSDVRVPAMHRVEAHNWYNQDFLSVPRVHLEPSPEREQDQSNLLTKIKNRFLSSSNKNLDVEQGRRASLLSNPEERYIRQTQRGRVSVMSAQQQEAVLEQTSIADFIRALSAITVPETMLPSPEAPKRKLGTAGLTPPKTSPPRTRRLAIRPNAQVRRTSLVPDTHIGHSERRFSLPPVDEHLLAPPPYSLAPPSENRPTRRFSVARMFNPPTISISPVQRQVIKRDNKDDS